MAGGRRQIGEQVADVLEGLLLTGCQVVRVAGLHVVSAGVAQLLVADLLASDRLEHVRPGHLHVRCAAHHDDEVGDGWRVGSPSGTGAHHQGDLRDDPGGLHMAPEEFRVEGEGDDTLLVPGATGVVDPDDGASGTDGEVHTFTIFSP